MIRMDIIFSSPHAESADRAAYALSRGGFISVTEYALPNQALPDHIAALRSGSSDLLALPLDAAPPFLPNDLVIAALTDRTDPAFAVLIGPNFPTPARLSDLPRMAKIGTSCMLAQLQLREIRPDWQAVPIHMPDELPNQINWPWPDLDAILCPLSVASRWLAHSPTSSVVRLNPAEFLPLPGSGTVAFLTLAHNLPLRRTLRASHHKDVANCTNVERRFNQLAHEAGVPAFGAWCHADANGLFHARAVVANSLGELEFTTASSVTSTSLPDLLWQQLPHLAAPRGHNNQ